eukprot:NODE_168_length_14557_cov_0.729008.p3 type:complete len:555 gc:universal NODE_168_length_14557_cov_0.729008:7183-8847(+)
MITNQVTQEALNTFELIKDNEYQNKNIGMAQYEGIFSCHCFYTDPCDSGCVNKELMIECTKDTCPVSSHCKNMRFQNREFKNIELIKTELKGFGIISKEEIDKDEFILEYVGEYITETKFHKRIVEYTKKKHQHFYGMQLRQSEYVDATKKGGLARFCNHSCNPNCTIQQWIVNDRLRMGLFAIRDIGVDEELTFDYNFERFGTPQKCYCGETNCRGYIGQAKEDMTEIAAEERAAEKQEKLLNATPYKKEKELLKMISMFLKDMKPAELEKCIYRLLCSDKSILLRFINFHGLFVVKQLLTQYTKERFYEEIIELCCNLPLTRKNYLESTGVLKKLDSCLSECQDDSIRIKLEDLSEKWNNLKLDIIISKSRNFVPTKREDVEKVESPSKKAKTEQTKLQQRSPPMLIEDDLLPKNWKRYEDARGSFYEHISGRRQTKRPQSEEYIPFVPKKPENGESSINSPSPAPDPIDNLDVDSVMAEIEQKKLENLKKSFESDRHSAKLYKQFRVDVTDAVKKRLSKYAPQWKSDKELFKKHAKYVTFIYLDNRKNNRC